MTRDFEWVKGSIAKAYRADYILYVNAVQGAQYPSFEEYLMLRAQGYFIGMNVLASRLFDANHYEV